MTDWLSCDDCGTVNNLTAFLSDQDAWFDRRRVYHPGIERDEVPRYHCYNCGEWMH